MGKFQFVVTLLLSSVSVGCDIPSPKELGWRLSYDLEVTAPRTTLRVGETVQLRVVEKSTKRDLTSPTTGTKYSTTSESMLIPEPDGRLTSIGTDGEPRQRPIIGVRNGKLVGRISFEVLAEGPGPSLEVAAEKIVLQEGEKTKLHVYEPSPGGNRKDVTATSTGTRYFPFAGYGDIDSRVVSIMETGLASATESIGHYNSRQVYLFVRNGNSVGWIFLRVIPKGGGPNLKVVAEKTLLREGEKIQVRVYKPISGGKGAEITDPSTGTQYHAFSHYYRHPPVISIDEKGMVTATPSLGLYKSAEGGVVARNGDSVGWIQLRVVRASER